MIFTVVLEIVIILIILFMSNMGYKNGLFKMAAKPAKLVICLVVSLLLYDVVGQKIIAPLISSPVKNCLKEHLSVNCSEICTPDKLPNIVKISAALFDIPIFSSQEKSWSAFEIAEVLANPLILTISKIIAFVLLYVLTKLVFLLVIGLANRILDIGILGQINRILGVLLSGFLGVGVAWIFVFLVDFGLSYGYFDGYLTGSQFKGGPLYRMLSVLSPLNLLLKF